MLYDKTYLSGPMRASTADRREDNLRMFHKVARRAREQSFTRELWNPVEHMLPEGTPYEEYIRRDLRVLLDCDSIIMLPNWTTSQGACIEYRVAREIGLARLEYVYVRATDTEFFRAFRIPPAELTF